LVENIAPDLFHLSSVKPSRQPYWFAIHPAENADEGPHHRVAGAGGVTVDLRIKASRSQCRLVSGPAPPRRFLLERSWKPDV